MKIRVPTRSRFPIRPFPSQDVTVTPLGEVRLFLCRNFEPVKRRTRPLLLMKTCTGDLVVVNWFCFTEYYVTCKTCSKTLEYPKDTKHYGADFQRQAMMALGFVPRSVTRAFATGRGSSETAQHLVHPLKKGLRMVILDATTLFLGIETCSKCTSPILFSVTERGFTEIHYVQYTKKVGSELVVKLVRARKPEDMRHFGFSPHTVDVVAKVASD